MLSRWLLQLGLEAADVEAGFENVHGWCEEVLSALRSDESVDWVDVDRLCTNLEWAWRICWLSLANGHVKASTCRGEASVVCPGSLDEPVAVLDSGLVCGEQETSALISSAVEVFTVRYSTAHDTRRVEVGSDMRLADMRSQRTHSLFCHATILEIVPQC